MKNREMVCHRGDVFIIPPYAVHSVNQKKDACLFSMCIRTAFIEETDIEAAEDVFRELLRNAVEQRMFGKEHQEKGKGELLPWEKKF